MSNVASTVRLLPGDVIAVYGWVMLAKVEGGRKYRVKRIQNYHGQPAYCLCPARGYNIAATHYAHELDPWIRDASDDDMNKIVILYRNGESYSTHS
jgi:hypothetical protein